MKKVMFVCTGNYYRSRYAEAYMNHLSALLKLGISCCSSGFEIDKADFVSELYGEISPYAKKRLEDQQIFNFASDNRKTLTEGLSNDCDMVIVLDRDEHEKYMKKYSFLSTMNVVFWSIKDIEFWVPKKTLDEIEVNCQKLAWEIWNEKY